MLLLMSVVHASAFYTPTEGVRAMGRGGAYIVGNHDLSAQRYNPAALRNIDGGIARVDLALVSQTVSFHRDGFDPVENLGRPFPIPSVGVAYGLERATVAFGLWTPYAPAFQYAPTGPQRFSMIDSTLIQTSVGPSASFDVLPWLTVGGSLAWNTNTVGRQVVLTTLSESDGGTEKDDIPVDMLVTDKFALGGTVALSVRPTDTVEVAASLQLPVRYDGKGYLSADFSQHRFYTDTGTIAEPNARDDDISVDIRMPPIVRGGVAWRPSEHLEVELSGDFQRWSAFEEIVLTDIDMTVDIDNSLIAEDPAITDDVVLPSSYQDSYSVRLGGELAVNDRVDVRGGAMYESSGVPSSIMAVDLVDGPKYGGGVGATAHVGGLDVDAGFYALRVQPMTIDDSEVHQIVVDVLGGGIEEGDVTGNGSYESLIWMPSVGLAYHF